MSSEFLEALRILHLTQTEAAQILSVDARTVRRWAEGDALPGPAREAIRGWLNLHARSLPWKPGSIAIFPHDDDHCAARRARLMDAEAMIARVRKRGGPQSLWAVDFTRLVAQSGTVEISFRLLPDEGFCLNVLSQKGRISDAKRDALMIEDAAYCIDKAQRKRLDFGPVLVERAPQRQDGKWRVFPPEHYAHNDEAILRCCELFNTHRDNAPHIRSAEGELLWNADALKTEWKKRKRGEKSEHVFWVSE